MQKHLMDPEFSQVLLNYLTTKPFAEVHQFIEVFKTLPLVNLNVIDPEGNPVVEAPVETAPEVKAEEVPEVRTPEVVEEAPLVSEAEAKKSRRGRKPKAQRIEA
jgi:hypothetical protein